MEEYKKIGIVQYAVTFSAFYRIKNREEGAATIKSELKIVSKITIFRFIGMGR